MSIGQAIRAARKARGWSQPELAKAAGVWPETVSRWETGVLAIPTLTRKGLETILGPLEGTVQSKRPRKAVAKS